MGLHNVAHMWPRKGGKSLPIFTALL
uniref:Uncharacterized protein n=1 Tax=Rhizophora mucronata TaxID=61149 RepID=A0A2P2NUE9_RHIMU